MVENHSESLSPGRAPTAPTWPVVIKLRLMQAAGTFFGLSVVEVTALAAAAFFKPATPQEGLPGSCTPNFSLNSGDPCRRGNRPRTCVGFNTYMDIQLLAVVKAVHTPQRSLKICKLVSTSENKVLKFLLK